MLKKLREEIKNAENPEKGKFLAGFFKTGKGQYGEGDIFYGITVPQSRKFANKYNDLPLTDITILLKSKVHEERLIALLILVFKFTKGDEKIQKEIFDYYLAHTQYINNWDLVDLSADKIVGEYLLFSRHPELVSGSTKFLDSRFLPAGRQGRGNDKLDVLYSLAKSNNLWEKRIAMIATFAFIKNGEAESTFTIAAILLHDPHDLIQKAVGWMLREVGKRVSEEEEEKFLKSRYKTMPRTALRYAIERFSEEKRRKYLLGGI